MAAFALLANLLLFAIPGTRSILSSSDSARARRSRSPAKSQQDQMPAEAGGPTGESGPIAVPKKTDTRRGSSTAQTEQPTDNPQYSLHVDVPVVSRGCPRPAEGRTSAGIAGGGRRKEHFKIWEDGVPQQIQSVTMSKAPITAVLLVEFAATNYNFMYDALNASYTFASQPAAAGLGGH